MRETQILRGLHKARANFADGFVSSPESQEQLARGNQSLRRIGAGTQTAKDLPFAAGDLLIGAVRQPLSAMYNGLRGGSQPASAPQVAAPNPNPASVAPTIIAPAIEAMQQRHEMMKGLAQGTAFLEGPGTGTSDSIPANLSRGEAVLPAKTVRAVGAHNIARLIQDTNDGKPPKGLRAGGGYARGGLPDLPSLDLSGAEGPQPMPDAMRTKPSVAEPAEAPAKPYTPPKVNPRTGAYVQGSTGTVPGTTPSVAQTPAVEQQAAKTWTGRAKRAFDSLNRAGIPQGGEVAAPKPTFMNKLGYGAQASGAADASLMQKAAKAVGAKSTGLGAMGLAEAAGVTQAPAMGLALASKLTGTHVPDAAYGDEEGSWVSSVTRPLDFIGRGLAEAAATGKYSPFRLDQSTIDAANAHNISAYDNSPYAVKPTPSQQSARTVAQSAAPSPEQKATQAPTAPAPNLAGAKPQGLAGGVTRYDIPGKAPLFTNLTGEAGAADNAALMGRGEITQQNMAAADGLDAKYRAESKALGLRQEATQRAQENSPGALLLQQIQRGLNNGGSLTRAGLAALQSLDATQRQYAATMAGHDVQRRGQDLSYDSSMYGHQTQAGLGALQRQIQLAEMQRGLQKDSLKETNENIERSPLVMGRDKDGNASPDKDKMARLKQFYGKVGFHSMDPAAQENANAQFGLSEAVRDHLSKAFGGVAPPPGAIKITGVRDAELADTAKGRGFVRGLLGPVSPGNYGKSVVLNVNGVEQAVPADLFDGDNLAYVNQALKQLGHEPLSPHHLIGGK